METLSDMVELNFRKFRLQNVEKADDLAVSGAIKPSSFDQYETASFRGGFFVRFPLIALNITFLIFIYSSVDY